jgi:hypothetical protein
MTYWFVLLQSWQMKLHRTTTQSPTSRWCVFRNRDQLWLRRHNAPRYNDAFHSCRRTARLTQSQRGPFLEATEHDECPGGGSSEKHRTTEPFTRPTLLPFRIIHQTGLERPQRDGIRTFLTDGDVGHNLWNLLQFSGITIP